MKRMQSLHWHELCKATTEFLAVARQYRFCEDLLDEIERRLYACSPFSKHRQ